GVTELNWTQNRIDVEPIGQVDTMEKIAHGRVWAGKDAASRDLLARNYRVLTRCCYSKTQGKNTSEQK
ncbi:hypothetical protein Tco_1571711, partial [Tanacetum coccineum]